MTTKYSKEFQLPPELPKVLRDLTREILRSGPDDINKFAAEYFNDKLAQRDPSYIKQTAPIKNKISENPYEALPETLPEKPTATVTRIEEKTEIPVMVQVASNDSIEPQEATTGEEKNEDPMLTPAVSNESIEQPIMVPVASNESIVESQEGTEES